jgi:acetamidase/formamidase
MAMGMSPNLDEAVRQAVREMISLLGNVAGLSRKDAYSLCSLGLELRVTQLVDGNKGIYDMMAKRRLSG